MARATEPSLLPRFVSPFKKLLVGWWFIFKDTEPSPLQDSFSVRQQGGLPGPPRAVVPHPESIMIDDRASYR